MRHSNRSTNYLVKNRYSYCFRLKVPLDLQNFIGKKELRYSLKTGFIGIANNKAWILAGKIQLLFNALRKGDTRLMNLTEDQIKELVEKYVKAELRNLDERVLNPFEEGFAPGYVDKSTMESYMDDLDDIRQDWLSKPKSFILIYLTSSQRGGINHNNVIEYCFLLGRKLQSRY